MNVVRDPAANLTKRVLKPVGKTCAWCLMVSEASWQGEPLRRGHVDCDCVIVLVRIDQPTPDWLAALIAMMMAARLASRYDDVARHDECYYIRRLYPELVTDGVFFRAPKFEWDGPVPTWDGHPHPPHQAAPADQAYWQARQEATGIVTNGAKLEPREILFVERMIVLGEDIEWIPKNRNRTATNDFLWRGVEFELKSPKANIGTIANDIKADTPKGKTRFVIDIGTACIPNELIADLSEFNQNHKRPIEELWLMSNGQMIQIPLS